MKNNPPTKINSFYGFRTKKSMKNEKSWHLAQKLLGDFSKKKGECKIFCVNRKKEVPSVE